MHDNDNQVIDRWEEALESQIKVLEQCQVAKLVDSCMKCDQILLCQVRKEYIKAVYESMNKGTGGGFEF